MFEGVGGDTVEIRGTDVCGGRGSRRVDWLRKTEATTTQELVP